MPETQTMTDLREWKPMPTRLPVWLQRKIKAAAAEKGQTMSVFVAKALMVYLKVKEPA